MMDSGDVRIETAPLLTTKFHVPPFRPQMIPRPHLIERLNQGLDRKLTIISAPAGFGKTTLLSEWINAMDREENLSKPQIAWLSLDPNDNDLARFWSYAISALQRTRSGVGEPALAALRSPLNTPRMPLPDL